MALSAEDKRLLAQMKVNREKSKPKVKKKPEGSLKGSSKRAMMKDLGIANRWQK